MVQSITDKTSNRFYKYRMDINWNKYRSHRNYVIKVRKICMRQYLRTHCEMSNGNSFWKIVKPLFVTIPFWIQKKGHNCQNVLLRLINKCKSNIDDGGISGALLTDLSKAFDYLPYRLWVARS